MNRTLSVEAEPYAYEFNPAETALLIIDMQRDFLEPAGFGEMLGNDVSQLRRTIEPNKRLLAAWRGAAQATLWVEFVVAHAWAQLAVLAAAGADLLACETLPCLGEALALARTLEEFPACLPGSALPVGTAAQPGKVRKSATALPA